MVYYFLRSLINFVFFKKHFISIIFLSFFNIIVFTVLGFFVLTALFFFLIRKILFSYFK